MGQHKTNPVVQMAKDGKLPPKPQTLSKRESERYLQALIRNKLFERFGLDWGINGPY